MHGMQRFPSLIQANSTMETLLTDYEIFGCEPLYDVKHHIENLYTELPHHLNKDENELMAETITTSFEQKESKRVVVYRKSLIKNKCCIKRKNQW